ncbi:MAG: SLC13/DASS family transporter [Acidobacteria bacterium]|nr:SLC13/DASS family transporter [Acidobacteriota bacterium]
MSEEPRSPSLSEVQTNLSPFEMRFERYRRTAGLLLGPLGFILLEVFSPAGLSVACAHLTAVLVWVLIWWICEAVPLPVTALLGPVLVVLLGVASVREAMAPFADPVIFLFLGGFVIAEGMSVHGLDRRIARWVLGSRWTGAGPLRVTAAFAVIAAGLSMWLSNSVTTAMLYPMAIGVLGAINHRGLGTDLLAVKHRTPKLANGLLLSCAYAASIGGVCTPIGTPPNLIAIGYLDNLANRRIDFFSWMAICLPITLLMLVGMLLIIKILHSPGLAESPSVDVHVTDGSCGAGPWSKGERNVTVAFGLAVTLWLLPGICALFVGTSHPTYICLQSMLPEGGVAIVAATLLFVLPVEWSQRTFTLTWAQVARIDWGTLILFGGGLSLGGMMFKTGLAEKIGLALVQGSGATSLVALTIVFTSFAVFFTEVVSNTATATMLVPLAISAAQTAGVSPVEPALGCALGCSMAFMFPVATPPNAIIYGSGAVRITTMIKTGWWLNLWACIVISLSVLVIVPLVLGR